MTALECIRLIQKMGWMLTDPGDHAVKEVTPVLIQFLASNPAPCAKCGETPWASEEEPEPTQDASEPIKRGRGRPKKTHI
jgi:hypothetical protein